MSKKFPATMGEVRQMQESYKFIRSGVVGDIYADDAHELTFNRNTEKLVEITRRYGG